MINVTLFFRSGLRIAFRMAIGSILVGCTTLEARLSLEPYTKNKQKRNVIEGLAETYCRQKRNYPGALGATKLPDFIFTTDGCSRAPDDHWVSCCITHDIAYWCGGSSEDREAADQFLQQCVNKQNSPVGSLYYAGVRLGGAPWLPTPWRWGYGWNDWPRDYETLDGSPPVIELLERLGLRQIVWDQLQE